MEYNQEETERIERLFETYKKEGVSVVVPRGHQNLPHSVPGGDIDIYVSDNEFRRAVQIAKEYDFSAKRADTGGLRKLAKEIRTKPVQAIKVLVTEPRRAAGILRSQVAQPDVPQPNSGYSEWRLYHGDVMLHLMNHVAYKSPMNGKMIRVDPEVESSLFKNSEYQNNIPVPSQSDELAHLLCRGIFTYDGKFPSYYVTRCTDLYNHVSSSEKKIDRFERLLSLLFFDADEVVLKNVEDEKYNDLKTDLLAFSNY